MIFVLSLSGRLFSSSKQKWAKINQPGTAKEILVEVYYSLIGQFKSHLQSDWIVAETWFLIGSKMT